MDYWSVCDFLSPLVAYGSWFDHVKSWLNAEDKEHMMHISYEEMIMVRHLTVCSSLEVRDATCGWRVGGSNPQTDRTNVVGEGSACPSLIPTA